MSMTIINDAVSIYVANNGRFFPCGCRVTGKSTYLTIAHDRRRGRNRAYARLRCHAHHKQAAMNAMRELRRSAR